MSDGDRAVALSWRDNGERLAVAVAANRLAARGVNVGFRCAPGNASGRAGDFLVPEGAAIDAVLRGLDLRAGPAPDDGLLRGATRSLRSPRIAVLAGIGSGYPYYAYYAHALASLGLRHQVLDAPAIAQGALAAFDLLVLPGGFSIWGLDRCEGTPGTDAAVRSFIDRGGACIGSCGGSYYLSRGRPGWLAVADASPRYTHEYLKSGAGIVSVRLAAGALGLGCAPALEMPYYHGPIYDHVRAPCEVAGWFDGLSFPADIPIANPLNDERFRADIAGRAAILHTEGPTGRAVLFSTHPEMGDIVRKHVALRSYVQTYLPIRGPAVMQQTLDFYMPNDAPCFRLIHNAVQMLAPEPASASADSSSAHFAHSDEPLADVRAPAARLIDAVESALLTLDWGDSTMAGLLRREVDRLADLARSLRAGPDWLPDRAVARVLRDALDYLSASGAAATVPHAQRLLDLEFPLRYLEAVRRTDAADSALDRCPH